MLELHLRPIYFHQKTNGNGKPPINEGKIYSNNNSLSSKNFFPDSKPSHQRNRAALTSYIINRRWVAMFSLEWMRDNSIPTQFLFLIRSHLINGLGLNVLPILSTEEGWEWTASKEWVTNPFQQQLLVGIHSHLIKGLELHLQSIYDQRKAEGNEQPWMNEGQIHSTNNSLSRFKAILSTG